MCNHQHGSVPYRCYKNGIILSKCQQECDYLASCVGFSETFATNICYLFPSSMGCPSGWDFDTGYVAVTSNQLIASERHGSNCYIKQGTILQRYAKYFILLIRKL